MLCQSGIDVALMWQNDSNSAGERKPEKRQHRYLQDLVSSTIATEARWTVRCHTFVQQLVNLGRICDWTPFLICECVNESTLYSHLLPRNFEGRFFSFWDDIHVQPRRQSASEKNAGLRLGTLGYVYDYKLRLKFVILRL